ncbi:MAG: GNAT family N-acetyltransferase [Bacteroidota bacterium]
MIYRALDQTTHLEPLDSSHVAATYKLITANREHLDRWLRWSSAIQTRADVSGFIEQFQTRLQQGNGFLCGIWSSGALAGAVVCWYIHPENSNAEIGYWLGEAFTGQGLATRASAKTIDYLFNEVGLHRIEMQCGVENTKSRAVPERLGFKLEGMRRASHWITNRFVDHAIYGMLSSEWKTHASLPREQRDITMDYALRMANSGDHDWLEDLRKQAYRDLFIATWGAWDEARHKRHFAGFLSKGNCLIIQAGQTDVGMIQRIESADRLTIEEIQVLPQYQRQGLGTAILKDTIAKAQSLRKDVYLSLGLKNTKAYRLYNRMGFEEYKRTDTHFHMRICTADESEDSVADEKAT